MLSLNSSLVTLLPAIRSLYISNDSCDKVIMELNEELKQLDLKEGIAEGSQSKNKEESNKKEIKRRRSSRILKNHMLPPPKVEVNKKLVKQSDVVNSERDLVKIYTKGQNLTKRKPISLETIFEEPKIVNNSPQYVSGKKFRRMISFRESGSAQTQHRVKKRQMKAKQVLGRLSIHRKKIPQDVFMEKLKDLLNDEKEDDS